AMLAHRLLKPASQREMETEVKLNDGRGTGYALGLQVGSINGHRVVRHGGEVSGFTAQNMVFPDDNVAVVALTNQDASNAPSAIARQIATALLTPPGSPNSAKLEQARKIFAGLQQGRIDRTLFTSNANSYFTPQALEDFASSLGPLGEPQDFTLTGEQGRGGMTFRGYSVRFPKQTLSIIIYEMPDGKLEQYLVGPGN